MNKTTNDSGIYYVNIDEIHPGQCRYSQINVDEKIKKLVAQKRIQKIGDSSYSLGLNKKGKPLNAALKKKEALPVIKAPFGLLLLNGHHRILASQQAGCNTIPVEIIEDHSSKSKKDFWKLAIQKNWVHATDLEGNTALPPDSFASLVNDPNRYFATLTLKSKNQVDVKPTSVWMKSSPSPYFIEFKIADIMYKNGLIYKENMDKEMLAELLKILLKQNKAILPGIELVDKS